MPKSFWARKIEAHDVSSVNGFVFSLAGNAHFNGMQPEQVQAFASAHFAPWVGPGLGAAEDPLRALPVVGLDAGGKLKVTVTIHSADWAAIPTTGAKGTRIDVTVLRGNE